MYFYSILRCIYILNVVELSLWQIPNVCFYYIFKSSKILQRFSPNCGIGDKFVISKYSMDKNFTCLLEVLQGKLTNTRFHKISNIFYFQSFKYVGDLCISKFKLSCTT